MSFRRACTVYGALVHGTRGRICVLNPATMAARGGFLGPAVETVRFVLRATLAYDFAVNRRCLRIFREEGEGRCTRC